MDLKELVFQSTQLFTYYWHRVPTPKLLTCGTRNQKQQCVFFLFFKVQDSVDGMECSVFLLMFFLSETYVTF